MQKDVSAARIPSAAPSYGNHRGTPTPLPTEAASCSLPLRPTKRRQQTVSMGWRSWLWGAGDGTLFKNKVRKESLRNAILWLLLCASSSSAG